jgi:fermentation-respiration switch protein FrsA (DUF1100 family)
MSKWGGPSPVGEPKGEINAGSASLVDVAGWEGAVSEHATKVHEGVAAVRGLLHELNRALGAMADPLAQAYGGQRAVADGVESHAGRLRANLAGSTDQDALDAVLAVEREVEPTDTFAKQLGALSKWYGGLSKIVGEAAGRVDESDCLGAAQALPAATKESGARLMTAAGVLGQKGLSL